MATPTIQEMAMTEQQDARAGYIAGLRALADVLEKHDEVPLPASGRALSINFWTGNPRTAMADAARAFPVTWRKHAWEAQSGSAYFELHGALHGLSLELCAYRDAVCERVVTGTETVTETVKDPEALAAVPEIEVTCEVETVEWRCGSLLAPAQPESMVTA
jgi:hypothetical protein